MLLLSAHTLSSLPPVERGDVSQANCVFYGLIGGCLPPLINRISKQPLVPPAPGSTKPSKRSANSAASSSGASQVRSLLTARGILYGCWRAFHRGHPILVSASFTVTSELDQLSPVTVHW
jgi:hypothetical protein